jgi:hypothetical protein
MGGNGKKRAKNGGNTEGFRISSVYGGILRKTEAVATLLSSTNTLGRAGRLILLLHGRVSHPQGPGRSPHPCCPQHSSAARSLSRRTSLYTNPGCASSDGVDQCEVQVDVSLLQRVVLEGQQERALLHLVPLGGVHQDRLGSPPALHCTSLISAHMKGMLHTTSTSKSLSISASHRGEGRCNSNCFFILRWTSQGSPTLVYLKVVTYS